jgi:protein MpaA
MQRLGKNLGKYFGETIDVQSVLRDVETTAVSHGWAREVFLETPDFKLLALHRRAFNNESQPPVRFYLSAGIHGDEPAGPLAVQRLLAENRWPANVELWLCPCLNPSGFARNTRENATGIDLNRQFLKPEAEEVRAHIAWLERQPAFDTCLCLHEDWESNGFYLYELNPDNRPSLAPAILESVAKVCPIDLSPEIEGRTAVGGLINPNIDPRSRPDWPEAFYLLTYKTRRSYTMEAPSDFPLATRVDALVAGVNAALRALNA